MNRVLVLVLGVSAALGTSLLVQSVVLRHRGEARAARLRPEALRSDAQADLATTVAQLQKWGMPIKTPLATDLDARTYSEPAKVNLEKKLEHHLAGLLKKHPCLDETKPRALQWIYTMNVGSSQINIQALEEVRTIVGAELSASEQRCLRESVRPPLIVAIDHGPLAELTGFTGSASVASRHYPCPTAAGPSSSQASERKGFP